MPTIKVPDYSGGSLPNLMAELETRLTGSAAFVPLHADLAAHIPDADTYVLVVFDGLGDGQLSHPAAQALRDARVAAIDAPFPATTTVSLATIATGLPPSQHGLLGYQSWLPEAEAVVNTIKWTTLWGDAIDYDTSNLLPAPNLWERLAAASIEAVTVQPAGFEGSPLTKALYRGCRFEGITTYSQWAEATAQLAAEPGRLVVAYLPNVDFAAHLHGQRSDEYTEAMRTVVWAWEQLALRLPSHALAVGTADHGHIDFPKVRQTRISKPDHQGRVFYGDGRAMFVRGNGEPLATRLPATWVPIADMADWWGPGPNHPAFADRAPDGVLVANDDYLLLHRRSDDRMVGNHGALTGAERRIPLLIAG